MNDDDDSQATKGTSSSSTTAIMEIGKKLNISSLLYMYFHAWSLFLNCTCTSRNCLLKSYIKKIGIRPSIQKSTLLVTANIMRKVLPGIVRLDGEHT